MILSLLYSIANIAIVDAIFLKDSKDKKSVTDGAILQSFTVRQLYLILQAQVILSLFNGNSDIIKVALNYFVKGF